LDIARKFLERLETKFQDVFNYMFANSRKNSEKGKYTVFKKSRSATINMT